MMSSYEEIVIASARRYIDQLERIPKAKRQATIVRNLYECALKHSSDRELLVRLGEATDALAEVPLKYRDVFCNQYSLGMGNPNSQIIFIGQEWAFDFDDTSQFIAEACLLTFMWMIDLQQRERVIEGVGEWLQKKLDRQAADPSILFNRSPNNFYQVGETGHTWRLMSKMITSLLGVRVTHEPRKGNFAEYSYFFEASAFPKRHHEETKITFSRQEFLRRLLHSLPDARYVVLHGFLTNTGQFKENYPEFVIGDLHLEKITPTADKRKRVQLVGRKQGKWYFLTQQLSGNNAFPIKVFEEWGSFFSKP